MGFRDDDLAARARIDALEQEVSELKREKAELMQSGAAGSLATADAPTFKKRFSRAALLATFLGLGCVVAAAYAYAERIGGDDVGHAFAFLAVFVFSFALVLFTISRLLVEARPGRLLVISGRAHRSADGQVRGYRLVRSGRAIKLPLLEVVSELRARPMDVPVSVRSVYARGNDPLHIEAMAKVRIAKDNVDVHNAVERFLGREEIEIVRVASETLEGALRTVTPALSAAELEANRLTFAHTVQEEAEEDLRRLGLELESFRIVDVARD